MAARARVKGGPGRGKEILLLPIPRRPLLECGALAGETFFPSVDGVRTVSGIREGMPPPRLAPPLALLSFLVNFFYRDRTVPE